MREDFDIRAWIARVEKERPRIDALVRALQNYGGTAEFDDESHDVSLHYSVQFAFPDDVVVTIGIILMDHQSDSDVVIETMTTLPQESRRKGFGSQAVSQLLRWAKDNQLKEVRATQVRKDNEKFWRDNGFISAPEDNPCNDLVWQAS